MTFHEKADISKTTKNAWLLGRFIIEWIEILFVDLFEIMNGFEHAFSIELKIYQYISVSLYKMLYTWCNTCYSILNCIKAHITQLAFFTHRKITI